MANRLLAALGLARREPRTRRDPLTGNPDPLTGGDYIPPLEGDPISGSLDPLTGGEFKPESLGGTAPEDSLASLGKRPLDMADVQRPTMVLDSLESQGWPQAKRGNRPRRDPISGTLDPLTGGDFDPERLGGTYTPESEYTTDVAGALKNLSTLPRDMADIQIQKAVGPLNAPQAAQTTAPPDTFNAPGTELAQGVPGPAAKARPTKVLSSSETRPAQSRKQTLLEAVMQLAPMGIAALTGNAKDVREAGEGSLEATRYTDAMDLERQREERATLLERMREAGATERAKITAEAMAPYRASQVQANQALATYRGAQTAGASTQAAAKLAAVGMRLNPETGEPENIPDEELPAPIAAKVQYQRAQMGLVDARESLLAAQTELARARAQAANNPNSAGYQQAQERLALARRRLAIAEQNSVTAAKRLNLSGQQFELKSQGTVGGEAPAGTFYDEAGNPIGWGAPGNPTANTKQMAETSGDLIQHTQRINGMVDQLDADGKLGPIMSRWGEFMAGKVGAGDPDYARFRTAMGMLSTAAMKAHVGARGSEALLEHFQNLLEADKATPEQLRSVLAEMNEWWKVYKAKGSAPAKKTRAASLIPTAEQRDMVKVKTADGQVGMIPRANAAAAVQRGAQIIP